MEPDDGCRSVGWSEVTVRGDWAADCCCASEQQQVMVLTQLGRTVLADKRRRLARNPVC